MAKVRVDNTRDAAFRDPTRKHAELKFGLLGLLWLVGTLIHHPGAHAQAPEGLTAVEGLRVGHFTLVDRPTGCTVILAEDGAVAGVDVRGGAPGTRETDLLAPGTLVQEVHGIAVSGGSAFGLDAASGVMRYLAERDIGFQTSVARVPIVPAAILFDLAVGDDPTVRPDAQCGYRAAETASTAVVAEGNVGAGAGATIGKTGGSARAMKGGLGSASVRLANGLVVAALVVVNAVGDVVDPATGKIVAGVRTLDGTGLADARRLLRANTVTPARQGENTTLGVVATNARLTQTQATQVARMAHDGFARAIIPSHTPSDGDAIFTLSTGQHSGAPPLGLIGALAADVVSEAILRGVRAATGIPGYPAARDFPAVP